MVSVQRNRRVRAMAMVAAALMVLGLWDPVENAITGRSSESSAFSGAAMAGEVAAQTLLAEEGAHGPAALEGIERAFGRDRADVPPWFEEEVFSLSIAEELRANEDWSVVGFASDRSCDEVRAWAENRLRDTGWVIAESGMEGSMSAIKEEGRAAWLLFSCRLVGGKTCVVVQVAAE